MDYDFFVAEGMRKIKKGKSKNTKVINSIDNIIYVYIVSILEYFKKNVQLICFCLQALADSQTHIIKQCEQCRHNIITMWL